MLITSRATAVVSTALLGFVVLIASLTTPSGASIKPAPSLTSQGKTLVVAKCAKCHGTDEDGIQGFSPGITTKHELRHYTKPLFERLMKTGLDNDGKKVRKPMPIFGFPASKADAIYAYLKTLS